MKKVAFLSLLIVGLRGKNIIDFLNDKKYPQKLNLPTAGRLSKLE